MRAITEKTIPRPLVFTNGVFDILHRGHVTYLSQAAQMGAALLVAVNSDKSAKRLRKSLHRPLNSFFDRAALVAALECVSIVVPFHENTPIKLISRIRPDFFIKGGDYKVEQLPESNLVKTWGGKAVSVPFKFGYSTSSLIRKIRSF